MTDIRSVEAGMYNSILAEALKKEASFKKPEWVSFVKSGVSKERPINEKDFWHKRAASILRQIYIREIVGVERLRTRYGGKKDRGQKPSRFRKGSGKIIRSILQQAEEAKFVAKAEGNKKGRKLTETGKDFMEKVINQGGKDDKTLSKKD
jgi:small subunit ribosomal protein S19e